jgi:hypothetical protein
MKYAAVLVLLVWSSMTAGCFLLDQAPPSLHPITQPTPIPTTESRVSTVEPSVMALQISDLPEGYTIKERSDVSYAEINLIARDEGWKKGYYVAFFRMNAKNYDITGISQQISIYPLNRMALIFDEVKNGIISRTNASVSVTELPFPKTGDRTIALRTIDANDSYGIIVYTVIFTKKDAFEQIEMRGTTTDYEVLKDITARAALKIR